MRLPKLLNGAGASLAADNTAVPLSRHESMMLAGELGLMLLVIEAGLDVDISMVLRALPCPAPFSCGTHPLHWATLKRDRLGVCCGDFQWS
jgi:hypothetical protein